MRLQEQRALAARTVQLQELMDLKTITTLPTIAAEIIAGNPNPGILSVTVNRGSSDGVQADMAVISPKGIVGRVIGRPASHAARVQLLVDSTAAAAALVERSRSGGIVVGVDGDPPLQFQLVSNLADVVPGDIVVTSGADGLYPKGFPIGRVEKSERGSGSVPADYGAAGRGLLGTRERAHRARAGACSRAAGGACGARAREMKTAAVIGALIVALALQTTLAGLRVGSTTAVNLVLVVVVYVGLSFGPAGGLVAGTVGGLIQDALAGGIIGVGGFSKTLVGFIVGFLGAQFIVSQTVPRFVMFVGATVVHEACFQALYSLVEGAAVPPGVLAGVHAGGNQRPRRHRRVPGRRARARDAAAPEGARRESGAEALLVSTAVCAASALRRKPQRLNHDYPNTSR